MKFFNQMLDSLSDFLSRRKGLLPIIGIVLAGFNFVLHLIQPGAWWVEAELFLSLGVIIAIIGVLLAWAL